MSDEPREPDAPAPDFAMHRAVEILAKVYETNAARRSAPPQQPAPLDVPVVLACGTLVLALRATTRADVERVLGVGFAYPMRGWHTYAARENGKRNFLSLFYSGTSLIAVEYYVPKADRAPGLAARDYGVLQLTPGDVTLGAATATLDARYTPAAGGPAPVVYGEAYEARFPGGIAYVMGNGGRIERLGLYAAS
ncbi:MAG TPA: hypothetical protein VHT53_02860 [Candidatus Elarobacter sp.]|jgi:hypothetical protein|nr:hypothetical protein [Candidatus Elarobacter sp.]